MKVSVIMPVFNAERFVGEAIQSILLQSFKDFEFIIIDDASTDTTRSIISAIFDSRIRFEKNLKNLGHSPTLNKALQLCQGDYIARMDADDIAHPERLEKQVRFLEAHPDVGVCGSQFINFFSNDPSLPSPGSHPFFCKKKSEQLVNMPLTHEGIRWGLLFDSKLCHPSCMIRKSMVATYGLSYDDHFSPAEDYDLWVRLVSRTKLANLPEALLKYRRHSSQLGEAQKKKQSTNAARVRMKHLEQMQIPRTSHEEDLHIKMTGHLKSCSPAQFIEAAAWYEKLFHLCVSRNSGTEALCQLGENWLAFCHANTKHGILTLRYFMQHPLRHTHPPHLSSLAKFFLKCSLKWQVI